MAQVLAGGAAADDGDGAVLGVELGPVDFGHVAVVGYAGVSVGEDLGGGFVVLAEGGDAGVEGGFDGHAEAVVAGAEFED